MVSEHELTKYMHVHQYKYTCDHLEERVVALQSCGLNKNLDVQGNLAGHAYYSNDFRRAYEISKKLVLPDAAMLLLLLMLMRNAESLRTIDFAIRCFPSTSALWWN